MGTTLTPPTTQPMTALAEANRLHTARAVFRQRLHNQPTPAASRDLCAQLLDDPPEVIAGMRLNVLLEAIREVGSHKLELLVAAAGNGTPINSRRLIRDLTVLERHRLIGALRAQAQ